MIEVITGPMFSGKTGELIKRINQVRESDLKHIVFKPEIESRNEAEVNAIATHDKNNSYPAKMVKDIFDVLDLSAKFDVVVIDEAQFFSYNLYKIVAFLDAMGKRIIVSGLDMDYIKEPFDTMAKVMAIADNVTKLVAVCDICGSSARYSKRIIYEKERVLIGSSDKYIASCTKCFIDEK